MNYKIFAIVFFFSCSGTDCENLPKTFESYDQAYSLISKSKFKYSEEIDTSKSSWIRSLKYVSCDNNVGFLLMGTDDKTYIHQDVPFDLWKRFKNAESYGTFWNSYLKNRYRLALKE